MSNKTQLQTNNTKLAALIETLSGKAAGGGSVDTCTIVINNEVYNLGHGLGTYAFTTFENGEISINFYDGTTIKQAQYKFENVVCGSIFHLFDTGYSMAGIQFDASISRPNGQTGTRFYVAPTVAGTTATITIYDDD